MSSFETRAADWLSYGQALDRVLDAAVVAPSESVPLAQAQGRILAEPVVAPWTLPALPNSAMDGYAVRGEDIGAATEAHPVRLPVVGVALPGHPWEGTLGPGQAVRIMTGGPVPHGADSVVRVEHTQAGTDRDVAVVLGTDAGRNVRPAGEDMQAGETLLRAGRRLTPGALATLASVGLHAVPVRRRPRVGVLGSGDELVAVQDLAEDVGPIRDRVREGRAILDSNSPMLVAQVREAGGEAVALPTTRDTEGAIATSIDRALAEDLDLLVTIGGASMGTHDLLKRVFEERGCVVDFWRSKIRPGSPVSLAHLPRPQASDLPVLGLPGNPASAFVTFEVLGRPMVLAQQGTRNVRRPEVICQATGPLTGAEALTVFLRVVVSAANGTFNAQLTGPQNSGLVSGLGKATGLAVLPEGVGRIDAGEDVRVLMLDDPVP